MAIKGQTSKENLIKELLEYFGDRAFRYDKDLRVNCTEDGQPCQIKINFTVSKVAVEKDGDTALPGENVVIDTQATPAMTFGTNMEEAKGTPIQPTVEEKKTISELLSKLGL